MLMHGKLYLTISGLCLDEVKSLLQKALRRKDDDLVQRAAKELMGRGKDQLQWKSLVTYLFEDHCLSDTSVLVELFTCFQQGQKLRAVELLLKCFTCRIAACLPVIAMDPKYNPKPGDWNLSIKVDIELQGLITKESGKINVDLLLQRMKKAWLEKEEVELITCMKLATMMEDQELRKVSQKGIGYLIGDYGKKPHSGLVVISMLYKVTKEIDLKVYLKYAFRLATIKEAPVRLILSSVVTYRLYHDKVKVLEECKLGQINWKEVPKLTCMPLWATDKHTFRGKCGKGTRHLLKADQVKLLNDDELVEFHENRPKVGVEHFFDEGCFCKNETLDSNPFWERTKQIYFSKTHRLQKTVRMSAVYHKELLSKYPCLAWRSSPETKLPKMEMIDSNTDVSESCVQKGNQLKRKANSQDANNDVKPVFPERKKIKLSQNESSLFEYCTKPEAACSSAGSDPASSCISFTFSISNKVACAPVEWSDWPLMQVPTGVGKVYTKVNLKAAQVWKGPYRKGSKFPVELVMFNHLAMQKVLGDNHTLSVEQCGQYIVFPMMKGQDATLRVVTKDFTDCIAKVGIRGGQFVLRDSMGIIQLHNLPELKMKDLPMTTWAHFLYRFALNIGDSGLYNAITDKHLSFIYGIDMEACRHNVRGLDLINLMFVMKPKKSLCTLIMNSIRNNKSELLALLQKHWNIDALKSLAKKFEVDFDHKLFENRINQCQKVLINL